MLDGASSFPCAMWLLLSRAQSLCWVTITILVQVTSLQLCLYAQSFARQMQMLFLGKHHTGAIQVSVELQHIHWLSHVSIALNASTEAKPRWASLPIPQQHTRTVTLTKDSDSLGCSGSAVLPTCSPTPIAKPEFHVLEGEA